MVVSIPEHSFLSDSFLTLQMNIFMYEMVTPKFIQGGYDACGNCKDMNPVSVSLPDPLPCQFSYSQGPAISTGSSVSVFSSDSLF